MNSALADSVRRHGALAGSILGLNRGRAVDEATALHAMGNWIHLDIIDASYPLGRGVDDATIGLLPEAWWPAIDVHLMVDTPPERLRTLLARAGRVTVHLRSPEDTGLLNAVLAIAPGPWISIEPQNWIAPDLIELIETHPIIGVLMMLATPAASGATAEPRRMDTSAWAAVQGRLPLGVDGGVTGELVATLADHGVSYFVVGRALFGENAPTSL